MAYQYSEAASRIMEYFLLPVFQGGSRSSEWELSSKERHILRDVFPIMDEIGELFAPYDEKIKSYYTILSGLSLLHLVYFKMLNQGLTPLTVEEVHTFALALSAEEIQDLLIWLVIEQDYSDNELPDFWVLLDESTIKPEEKWHIGRFYRQPQQSMQELVDLSRQLIVLYEPYYRKGQKERERFAETFSLEEVLESWLGQPIDQLGLLERPVQLHIVSPWFIRLASYQNDEEGKRVAVFIASCRIDELYAARNGFDLDDVITTLKTISDSTRYQVLVELTKPHAKSKDIAEALNITGAAVSFHTQKLLNAQLLVVNAADKTVKYDVNKPILKELIRKLSLDLGLDD